MRDWMKPCLDRHGKARLRDIGEARFQLQKYLSNPADRTETAQPVSGKSVTALPAANQRASARKYWVTAVAGFLVAMAGTGVWYCGPTARNPPIESTALVPFPSSGGNAANEFL